MVIIRASDRSIEYRILVRSVGEVLIIMRKGRKLSRLRDDTAVWAGLVPLSLKHIDLGRTSSLGVYRPWVIFARAGTGTKKGVRAMSVI